MIGIVCAMKEEVDKINSLMTDRGEIEVDGLMFTRGEIANNEVVTTVCGMGKVFASMYTQAMISEFLPDVILSFGAAGTLVPELHIGDVAIADRAVQYDMDVSPLGSRKGEITELKTVYFESHKGVADLLSECAEKLSLPHYRVSVATGDTFVASEGKSKIRENFDVQIAEMEGAAIAQVCAVHKIPYCIVRVISDEADGHAPENFTAFLSKVTEDAKHIIKLFCEVFE